MPIRLCRLNFSGQTVRFPVIKPILPKIFATFKQQSSRKSLKTARRRDKIPANHLDKISVVIAAKKLSENR